LPFILAAYPTRSHAAIPHFHHATAAIKQVRETLGWGACNYLPCRRALGYATSTRSPRGISKQNEPNISGLDKGRAPIVQVVLQIAVADAKLELLQKGLVLEDIKCVEHVEVEPFGQDQRVVHQLRKWRGRVVVVIRIGGAQRLMLVVAENGRGQRVERDHVRQLLRNGIFHHIRVDDTGLREHPMLKLGQGDLWGDLELRQESVELCATLFAVGFAHRPQPGCLRLLGQLIELNGPCERHTRCQSREAHLDELLGVERTVPVAALGYRLREHDARRVCGLKEAAAIDTTSDLLDEHGRKPFGAQLLMDAEEVDLDQRAAFKLSDHGQVCLCFSWTLFLK